MTVDSATPAARRRTGFARLLYFLRDVIVIVLIAAVVSFLIKTFVVRSFYIPSGSMERTLLVQDRILVDELTPRWTGYDRGDVVVFQDPGGWLPPRPHNPSQSAILGGIDWVLTQVGLSASDSEDHLVKRVIGLPGDEVVCCNPLGQITVNGAPIDESSYVNLPPGATLASAEPFSVTVPPEGLWVLGDNRNNSQDSRAHAGVPGNGFVPVGNVVGRAFFTTWPFDRFGVLEGHQEVFNGVPEPR